MTITQPPPDEPLSPELVLVLPPEERARVLANLGPPVRPIPPLRVVAPRPAPVAEPFEPLQPSLPRLVAARLGSLGVIFLLVTILTLAMSLVAHALRTP